MKTISPSKIVCVGRNYAKHAAELGGEVPDEPLIFFKPPSSLIGEGDAIVMPAISQRVDFEGEIGVIIGKRGRNVPASEAWALVESLVPVNDITARDLQRIDDQWARAKGFDTFCAVGTPVPLAEVVRSTLGVITRVNGEVLQEGDAADMVFDIPTILEYITSFMTLEPGDLVATGTPEGVAPLHDGDVVEIEVVGVGSVKNPVVQGG